MVLDSSVLLQLIFAEPGYQETLERPLRAEVRLVGAPTLLEVGMVVGSRLEPDRLHLLDELLDRLDVQVIPFEAAHAREALSAFRRFSKGRHPAALNFGDYLSYAVAKVSGLPLAYVGDDFAQTNLA
ncbi:MAG: type II toxin-antitoxin system VapC family toxin [Meiothermus sp.]|uniref:type II toxin-antitoxin system VapC family toxin n=1 Tax=Meiothermus sp. TaxID=1955249 RepID=UPI0025D7C924|nr:type II toxin-antitoxin system VapC family toxin [Meiothermus sp.]MCS7069578.1 type II toxin-antitoxin system VapC family toxin [Meiothermus sp.]MDW8425973.1 type II toxin-antitoxin system VapC family toxin [Meiothermus sp.]